MILSIDAGFNCFGWAWFEWKDNGWTLNNAGWTEYPKPSDKKKALRRSDALVEQSQWMYRAIMKMMPKAQALIVELPSGGAKSATAMRAMGMASAIIGCAAAQQGVPAEWITPNEVKQAMAGSLSASKDDIIKAAFGKYPLFETMVPWRTVKGKRQPDSRTEHAADAIGAFEAARNGQLMLAIGAMRPRSEETTASATFF